MSFGPKLSYLSGRQIALLRAFLVRRYIPMSWSDSIDQDIAALIRDGYVQTYYANAISMDMAYLTELGHRALNIEGATNE